MTDDPPAVAHLRPAGSALAARRAVTAVCVGVLLTAFLAAVVTLPTVAAVGVAAALAAGAVWLARRVSVASQCGLVATTDGVVVRLGAASAELAWRAVDTVLVVGSGRRVAVAVRAGRLDRELPRVFDAADAHRWLGEAAALAALAGRDDLTVTDHALTSDEPPAGP